MNKKDKKLYNQISKAYKTLPADADDGLRQLLLDNGTALKKGADYRDVSVKLASHLDHYLLLSKSLPTAVTDLADDVEVTANKYRGAVGSAS
ncbi:bacteriocin immunity protein [Lacticaseibacillus zhaodongensis]|uniref:bacteriocin immunity protein n=1 Tax=Lacticaseibacillus zhaodongensis TaxID=2668065 RepID=UPI0018B00A6C|nr:bacteriocin immunity protein [Lacticaseibacillus zhaodongensis]